MSVFLFSSGHIHLRESLATEEYKSVGIDQHSGMDGLFRIGNRAYECECS